MDTEPKVAITGIRTYVAPYTALLKPLITTLPVSAVTLPPALELTVR